jgi:hypothetical protein
MSPDCHLSFVVTTRNDNHGGDMVRRFQTFAETLLEQANRRSLWDNMYRTNRPIRFNTEDWGLADCPLNEVILQSGEKQYLEQSAAVTSKGELTWDSMDHHPSRLSLSSV